MATERATLEIFELGCGGGGALMVERALARLHGVARAYVNPHTEMAYVEYDPGALSPLDLMRAVAATGFRAGVPVPR